jgi:hypothetical protein
MQARTSTCICYVLRCLRPDTLKCPRVDTYVGFYGLAFAKVTVAMTRLRGGGLLVNLDALT